MTRLAATPVRLPAMTEAEWQAQVTQIAEIHHYAWVHFRPAKTAHGWRTPVQGPLGKGWPDLVLSRARGQRLIFVELKREGEVPTPDQRAVLRALEEAGAEVHVWSPSQIEEVAGVLR